MKRTVLGCLAGLLVPALVLTLLSACGGGGGGDDDGGGGTPPVAAPADVSPTVVSSSLQNIDTYIPGCQAASDAQPMSVAADAQQTFNDLSALAQIIGTFQDAQAISGNRAVAPIPQQTIQGDCGGTAEISSVHADGDTTFTIVFDQFCSIASEEPDATPSTIDGTVTLLEDGTPTPDGPSVSRYTAAVDHLALTSEGQTIQVDLIDFVFELGTPGTELTSPTAENPDQLSINSLSITYVTEGNKVHQLTDFSASVWETETEGMLDIASGRYTTDAHGYLDISTPSTLTVNEEGVLIAGELALTGENGTIGLTPTESVGIFNVAVNGEPIEGNVDCTENASLLLGSLAVQ